MGVGCFRTECCPRCRNNGGSDDFTVFFVRDADDLDVLNPVQLGKDLFNFLRGNVFAAPYDQVLAAPGEVEVSVLIQVAEIACGNPAVAVYGLLVRAAL